MLGDYSNELSATPFGVSLGGPAVGFAPGILGAKTEVAKGEVEGKSQEILPTVEPLQPTTPKPQPLGGLFAVLGSIFTALLSFFGRFFGR